MVEILYVFPILMWGICLMIWYLVFMPTLSMFPMSVGVR